MLSAGFPSAAEGFEDEELNLHQWMVARPAATFFFWVRGDCLVHEHIRDGSLLIIDRSVKPKKGRLALVEEVGEFVVRRFDPVIDPIVFGSVLYVVTPL